MTKSKPGNSELSRRDAFSRLAGAALGLTSVFADRHASAAGTQRAAAPPPARQGVVETVLGPIETARLGFTLSHEHICGSSAGFWQAWPEIFGGRAQFIREAVDKLKEAKDEGVDSIIDVTTFDLGRDIRLMEEVSRKSGVQVVACTGHWLDVSRSMNVRTVEELTDFFIREIRVGIEGTDIKAGVIKVGNAAGAINPFGERILRAAARACKATGVPVTTHAPAADRMGEKQALIFENEGLSPSKVCIGHSDSGEAGYQTGLLQRGYYLGMDQLPFGLPPAGSPSQQPAGTSVQARLASIKALVDAGFARQLMLSNDWLQAMSYQPTANEAQRKARNPDGFLFVKRKAIPALKAIGVSEQAIRTMTIDSPKRYFDGA